MATSISGNWAFLWAPATCLIAALGLIIGSFLNVCILRLPEGQFFANSRSQCRHCGHLIPFWYNIPVLSFFWLRGKSACCRKPLLWQYPLIELLTGALFVWVFWWHPFLSTPTFSVNYEESLRFAHNVAFCSLLIVGTVIDMRYRIIPDEITLGMICVAPLLALVHPELSLRDSLWGILLGGGVIYAIAWIYYLLRKAEGIGMGDAKLLAGIGGWCGYQAILPTLFYASVLGSLYGLGLMLVRRKLDMKYELPFGPFLALAAFIYLFQDRHISEIVRDLFMLG